MKVALFSDCYYPIINGVVTLISQLREGLIRQGHEVVVLTVRYPKFRKNEPGILRFPTLPISMGNQQFGYGVVSSRYVTKFLRDNKIDLIHSHTEFALDVAAIKAAKKLGIPYIHTYHTMWEDYLHYLPKWLVSPESVRKLYGKRLEPASAVFAPSMKAHAYVKRLLPSAPVAVVPNGINVDKFQATPMTPETKSATRAKFGIGPNDQLLLFVGRIGPEKRVKELQQALIPLLKADPSLRVAFIGDGGDIQALRQVARDEELTDRFILPGFIEWKDIYAIYSIATVYVTSSLSEVHPMTVIEALVCGLPVIARRDASYLDQVLPGENGELVDSEEALTEAVRALLADSARLQAYSRRSTELSHKFTAAGHVERTLSLYKKVLEAYPGRPTDADLAQ